MRRSSSSLSLCRISRRRKKRIVCVSYVVASSIIIISLPFLFYVCQSFVDRKREVRIFSRKNLIEEERCTECNLLHTLQWGRSRFGPVVCSSMRERERVNIEPTQCFNVMCGSRWSLVLPVPWLYAPAILGSISSRKQFCPMSLLSVVRIMMREKCLESLSFPPLW